MLLFKAQDAIDFSVTSCSWIATRSPDVKSWLIGKTLMLGKTEGRRRRGRQRMRWLVGITGMSLSKPRGIVKDRETWHAAAHWVAKSWPRLSDWASTKPGHLAFKLLDYAMFLLIWRPSWILFAPSEIIQAHCSNSTPWRTCAQCIMSSWPHSPLHPAYSWAHALPNTWNFSFTATATTMINLLLLFSFLLCQPYHMF